MSEKLLDGFGERCREGGRGSKKEASAAPVSERKQEDKEKRK